MSRDCPRVLARWTAVTAAAPLAAAALLGCRSSPDELTFGVGQDAASSEAHASTTEPLHRDDAGHLVPHASPSPPPRDVPSKPSREPDWDLDGADAAREYVRRYVTATKRYGDDLHCVELRPSSPTSLMRDRRTVEVSGTGRCSPAGGVRDVFLVDVAGDRLTLDDKTQRAALARWPDGSDPEGPAGDVRRIDDLRKWKGNLGEIFREKMLVPVRVQAYGRGTYPVVTIAGWHGDVVPTAPLDDLASIARELCKADDDLPLGIFAGIDRSLMLRVQCPGEARWDRL
jgi:hypothetical protein